MEITPEILQQMIRKEIKNISLKEDTPQITRQDIKKAEKIRKSEDGQEIFAKLEKDPKVQEAIKEILPVLESSPLKIAHLGSALLGTDSGKALVEAIGLNPATTALVESGLGLPLASGYIINKIKINSLE